MNFSTFLLILIGDCLTILALDEKNSNEKCEYRATVDLTNQTRYNNGSYVYQNVLIPIENIIYLKENVTADQHLRGCVCDRPKPCIKLCCKESEFFNTTSHKCEKLMDDFAVNWNIKIHLENDKEKDVNVFKQYIYQVGLPCNIPEALIMDGAKWQLEENGYLFTENSDSKLVDSTLNYCLTPYRFNGSKEYILVPLTCLIRNTATWYLQLNTYAMTLSIFFLIPTIVVYLMFNELRGNLSGKLLICYLISLTMGYVIITYINLFEIDFDYIECSLLGFTCYFFFMSAFLWLSVLCYDIWTNFKETNFELKSQKKHQLFIYYSIYAWGLAIFCTSLVVAAELSPHIASAYKPGIGFDQCWLNTKNWSAAIYFYGPNLIIVIFNFATFGFITMRIYRVRRDLAKITQNERFIQENAVVILRLFLIMGISWLFDIISYAVQNYKIAQVVLTLSDFVNAIQGLLIFILFVCKRNVLNLLNKRFKRVQINRTGQNVTSLTENVSTVQTAKYAQSQKFLSDCNK